MQRVFNCFRRAKETLNANINELRQELGNYQKKSDQNAAKLKFGMLYFIRISGDLAYWVDTKRKNRAACFNLIEAIMRDPFTGSGNQNL